MVATDLRRAERSLNMAARETAQFLLTTLDVTESHKLDPALLQRTVKEAVGALAAIVEGQDQLRVRAHASVEIAGRKLGLTATDWGEGYPKQGMETETVEHPVSA